MTKFAPISFLRNYKDAIFVFVAFLCYFGLLLIPNFSPNSGTSIPFLLYFLSVLLVLVVLSCVAAWGLLRFIFSQNQAQLRKIGVAAIGFGAFASCLVVDHAISGGLPAGSNQLKFDPTLWSDSSSDGFVANDVTARQKMLLDVVRHVLPGHTQVEIEQMLGPGAPNGFLSSFGYDLIYRTGPQRDSLFPIDSEWLLIWLDGEGKFARYEIASD